MTIRKKSKEELQNQAEGFLDYASERGKITEKQKKRISKILGISESEKKGFFERLSKKFGKEIDISDEFEIKKVLKKKKIDVEKLGAEYSKYLKIVKFFEPYKTPFDDLNAKIINFISNNYSSDIIKKAKIFMSSKFYKEEYLGGITTGTGYLEYFLEKIKDPNDLELFLNNLSSDILRIFDKLDKDTIKTNLLYLKEHGYNTYMFDYTYFLNEDIIKYVDFIEKCDIDLFWDNFNQCDQYYDEELKNLVLKFKNFKKNDLLINCLKYDANDFDKIINKRPSIYNELAGGYKCRFVHMAHYSNEEYKERYELFYDHYSDDWQFLAYLWGLYWTTNWKRNIDFLYEKGLIQSNDIIDDNDNHFSKYDRNDINCDIARLKLIDNDILKSLISGNTSKNSFDEFMMNVPFSGASTQILKLIIERYKVDLNLLVKLEGFCNILSNAKKDNFEIIFGKYDINKLPIEKIVEAPGLFIDAIPENLKIIFDEYENIEYIELMDLGNTVCNLSTECLQLIIGHYKNVGKKMSYTELEDLAGCFSHAKLENLKIILDKFDNIDDIKKLTSKNLASKELHIYGKPRNLKIILDRFDDVDDIQELAQIIRDAKLENLKIIFEKFDKQGTKLTPKDLDELNNVICLAIPENLELIFEKFLDINKNITVNDLKEFDVLLRFCYGLPKDLIFKESNKKGYLVGLIEIVNSNYENELKCNMMRTLVSLNFQEAGNLLKVYKMLDNSISPDIQLIKNQLIVEILKAGDPLTLSKIIINIFEKNNLPMIGKIFKIFELLYPKSRIESLFQKYPYSSPELKSLLDEGKNVYELIYRDLMNIAVKSGDRSLREYLKTFIGSEKLLKKFEDVINEEGFDPNDDNCLEGKFDEKNREKDEEMQAQLLYLFRKIVILYNRYFGKEISEDDCIESLKVGKSKVTDSQLVKLYDEIKRGFNLKGKNHSLYDKLKTLLYVNGLKYRSPEEVLDKMEESKKQAHERGLKLYNEAIGGKIKFPEEAFVKGVSDLSFKKIIGRGITSREYLGSGYDLRSTGVCGSAWGNSATSDSTPFDIDGFCSDHFVKAGSSGGISGSDKESSIGYGYVNFVIDITKKDENGNLIIYDNTPNKNDKNKLRWDTIRRKKFDNDEKYNSMQYELFQTETSEGVEHCGIRTGIAMTEVDYIIYTGNFEGKDFQNMCYEIARNGYYIPVTDREGNIKFTPEMYHKIRLGFNFMEYYDGFDVEQKDGKWESKESDNEVHKEYTGTNDKITDDSLKSLIAANSPNNDDFIGFAKENRELAENTIEWIKEILENQCWIKFNSKHDTSITGAEIHDSGSTGRGTDIPTKDVDLDFTLLLDAADYDNKLEQIKDTIYRVTGTEDTSKGGPRTDSSGRVLGYQIKSEKNTLGKSAERPTGIPLDLLILKKSQVIDYSSSDAMKEKLNFIASNPKTGEEDLNRVRTNVIIMKKLLKGKNCYKKTSGEGGIAGIGVENWITQHHGSFIEALESFEKVAYGGKYEDGKQPLPLKDFQELYPIYDAGENYKDGCNDNFVYKLNPHGYDGMLQIVQSLRLEGIDGIRKIIKNEYEKNKKKFTG